VADLRVIDASLNAHHARRARRAAPAAADRAVQVFGFHLATVDLRQSSDQHEAVIVELLRAARLEDNYSASTRWRAASCCCSCSTTRARCACTARRIRSWPRASWPSSRPALKMRATFGHESIRHYIISHTEDVSDLLEVMLLQKECGLMRGTLDGTGARRPRPT
jgi:phosphoenolpyruvate carboxylase